MSLTPAWFQLRYHRQQDMLWRTKARFVAVAAGRGSGKTEIARRRVVRMLPVRKQWHNPMYFYALPTYKQAQRVAWNAIRRLIPDSWIRRERESDMYIETVFGSSLFVVGLDKPQRVEGDQWDGCVIDESSDQKPGAFGRSILPALSHRYGWCWRIGVPKRYGVGAVEFREFWEKGAEPGTGAQHERYGWPSEDILVDEQLQWARDHLDAKDYAEQYLASWELPGGRIFHAYDDTANVSLDAEYRPDRPIVVGSDFNVDPMAWVFGHLEDDYEDNPRLQIFDELWMRDANTQRALDELFRRYGTLHKGPFWFFGDAAGRARNTRASASDYAQIKNDNRFVSQTFYPRKNPQRMNRFSACNSLFKNAAGERRCIIHPRCKNLRRDLLNRSYEEGCNEPADKGDVGHITDALGYVIYKVWPLRPQLAEAPSVGV